MHRVAGLFVFALQGTMALAADDLPSLCDGTEIAVFSCTVGARKIVSLCASHDLSATTGTMTYRYGRHGAIEMTYPLSPMHPSKAFTAGVDNTPGDYVRFSRTGTTYTVFSSLVRSSSPHPEAGVLVSVGAKLVARLICKGDDDGLGPDAWKLMYSAKLPQDPLAAIDPTAN